MAELALTIGVLLVVLFMTATWASRTDRRRSATPGGD